MKIIQSEFIRFYCENSKMSEKRLNELGHFSIVCDCEEDDCSGWAMVSRNSIKAHVDLYIKENK